MNQPIFVDLLLVIGTLALVIRFVTYQMEKMEWLKRHGRRIVATVTSIRHETGKTPTGFARDNYYVTATWTHPRTGRTYTFWTWIMNRCPAYTKGSLVPVVIDPNNPRRYIMDS
jgi:uncharacterized protein DUF3592